MTVTGDRDATEVHELFNEWQERGSWPSFGGAVREAFAAGERNGLARGRELGARDEREALVGIISDRMKRCGHRTGTCRSCMEDGAMIEIIEARRAGRGTS